jgi:hypothetical protein
MKKRSTRKTRWRAEVIEPKVIDILESAIKDVQTAKTGKTATTKSRQLNSALKKLKKLRQQFDAEPLCFRPGEPE